jgi:hypothetical protein
MKGLADPALSLTLRHRNLDGRLPQQERVRPGAGHLCNGYLLSHSHSHAVPIREV